MNKENIKLKEIFTQLYNENNWNIFILQKKSYSLNSNIIEYKITDEENSNDDFSYKNTNKTPISLNDFLNDFDFSDDTKNILQMSKKIEFKILANFIPILPITKMNTLNKPNNFLSWWYDLSTFQRVETKVEDVKNIFKYHKAFFSNSNLSSLFEFFRAKEFNNKDKHEIFSFFCINHQKKITSNLTARNYLIKELKNILPEYSDFYKDILFIEDKKELFVDVDLKFTNIFISKAQLIKSFPLNFIDNSKNSISSDNRDYLNILTFLVSFLNKNQIKKTLNIGNVFLNAKQESKPYYIINIEHSSDLIIKESIIKNFIKDSFSYTSDRSQINSYKNIYSLKDELKKGLLPILNSNILELALPNKSEKRLKTKKI